VATGVAISLMDTGVTVAVVVVEVVVENDEKNQDYVEP